VGTAVRYASGNRCDSGNASTYMANLTALEEEVGYLRTMKRVEQERRWLWNHGWSGRGCTTPPSQSRCKALSAVSASTMSQLWAGRSRTLSWCKLRHYDDRACHVQGREQASVFNRQHGFKQRRTDTEQQATQFNSFNPQTVLYSLSCLSTVMGSTSLPTHLYPRQHP
jgi:hypothetical protein